MATNDFIPFATSGTANVYSNAEYVADTDSTNGNQPGIAKSKLVNKALRQSSSIAAALAQAISDMSGDNVLDDGNIANKTASFKKAIALQGAITIATVADLATISSIYTTAIIKDDTGRGHFNYKTAVEINPHTGALYTVDGGTVYAALGGGFWAMDYSGAVNVKWFGAVGDGITDDTLAITNAQISNKNVFAPSGTYIVIGLRVYNKVRIIGEGYENTIFKQGNPSQPAINCLSDISVGQLSGLELKNFKIVGAVGATVSAVLVAAYGAYAIWKSVFDFTAQNTYTALEIQGNDSSNVFWCEFKITSENTSYVSVIANGGVYNKFSLFLTQCYNRAYEGNQISAIYNHLVTEGPIMTSDQNSIFNTPTIENLPQVVLPRSYCFYDTGFNNTWNTPTVIMNTESAAKITVAVFAPFVSTTVNNPRFLMTGTKIANPFAASLYPWTLNGGGNECTNKLDTVYDNTDNTKDIRKITIINGENFTNSAYNKNNLQTQVDVRAGGTSFNYQIKSNTDSMIFDHSATTTLINVSMGYTNWVCPNGKILNVYTTNAITALTWSGGGVGSDKTLFPLSMTAGQKIRMVYNLSLNKWFPA